MEDKEELKPEPNSRSKPLFSHGAFSIDSLLKPQLRTTSVGDRFQGFRPIPFPGSERLQGLLPERLEGAEETLQDSREDTIEYNEDSGEPGLY